MVVRKICVLIVLLALVLGGCAAKPTEEAPLPPVEEAPVVEPQPNLPEPEPLEPEPSKPLHSELYLPHCTVEQMTEYFEEVVLNVEYTDGEGDAHLVQKWLTPLTYWIYGTPTDADLEVLNGLFAQLNGIPGFPGIHAAAEDGQESVSIRFVNRDTFRAAFSDVIGGEEAFGAVQFWYYTDSNELHTARIGYRTDLEQHIRNSVLVEEVINILGITDTVLRPDSITYQYSDEALTLSDVDLVILKLLYSPEIQCGMDAAACAAVIRELYY